MTDTPISQRPWWVKVSIMGSRTRATLWTYFWGALAIGVGGMAFVSVQYGAFAWPYLLFGVAAAVPYYFTVRWLERHDGFTPDGTIRKTATGIDPRAYD